MSKTSQFAWIIVTVLSFVIGLWPIGIASLIFGIVQNKDALIRESKTEAQFYKTAAEIEQKLNNQREEETRQ